MVANLGGKLRDLQPRTWFIVYIAWVLVVSALIVGLRISSAWITLLTIPIPILVMSKPTRYFWPMSLLLGAAYWTVNLANHPEDIGSNLRASVLVLVTVVVVCEVLYRTGRARLQAEAALVAINEQLTTAIVRANEMAAVAQEADQIKSDFLASTSHELRTPLTGIIGSLDLVLSGQCEDRDEERRFVQIAHDSSQRLLTVVNAVLDIARLEAGKVEVEHTAVNLTTLAGEVCDLYRFPAADHGLTLDLHLPDDGPPYAWADADMVRQILLNLVGNAIKFTDRGRIAVNVQHAPNGKAVIVSVTDTGIGIAPDKQHRLFQPFVQADREIARRFGGTGLGLAISRKLAERMRGSIELFSEGEGHGSTFTLTLPAAKPVPATSEAAISA